MAKSYKGRFTPKNPKKYRGDPTTIIYRSLWERRFMVFCDETDSVLEWSSEEVIVPYFNPLDRKQHRYFIDFWVKTKEKDGQVTCKLIEIKPFKQTQAPKQPKRQTPRYLKEVETYIINKQKWDAASSYAASKNWKFIVLTENDLFK